jgi:hypothetical protein
MVVGFSVVLMIEPGYRNASLIGDLVITAVLFFGTWKGWRLVWIVACVLTALGVLFGLPALDSDRVVQVQVAFLVVELLLLLSPPTRAWCWAWSPGRVGLPR